MHCTLLLERLIPLNTVPAPQKTVQGPKKPHNVQNRRGGKPMHKTMVSPESILVVVQIILYACTRSEHSFTDFFEIYNYKGSGPGSDVLRGESWSKTKTPRVTFGRRGSFFNSIPDPLKPTVGRKSSKIWTKGVFYPRKGQKGLSQSIRSKFDRYHRNQRPKKR